MSKVIEKYEPKFKIGEYVSLPESEAFGYFNCVVKRITFTEHGCLYAIENEEHEFGATVTEDEIDEAYDPDDPLGDTEDEPKVDDPKFEVGDKVIYEETGEILYVNGIHVISTPGYPCVIYEYDLGDKDGLKEYYYPKPETSIIPFTPNNFITVNRKIIERDLKNQIDVYFQNLEEYLKDE